MTREEVIELARTAAEAEGWTWLSPVEARLSRVRGAWVVTSNASRRGRNVRVTVDDATGEILSKSFGPR